MKDLVGPIEDALRAACELGPGCPPRLAEAIRYAVLAPGKRLRPALVLMAAEACGGTIDDAMPGAVAVEMIHAYSLIHDDLPSMDDDDLRRGRPTVHIRFDEATAILAGDALQPLAVTQLCKRVPDPIIRAQAIEVLVTAAGPEHLVGGQADDLAAESGQLPAEVADAMSGSDEPRDPNNRTVRQEAEFQEAEFQEAEFQEAEFQEAASREAALAFLESIHRRKTGALFAASLELGAVLCSASPTQRDALSAYAADIGLAFQVVDDLLDFTAEESKLGKRVRKDDGRGKLTYPGLLGIEQARTFATELITAAKSRTDVFGDAGLRLNQLADFVLARTH